MNGLYIDQSSIVVHADKGLLSNSVIKYRPGRNVQFKSQIGDSSKYIHIAGCRGEIIPYYANEDNRTGAIIEKGHIYLNSVPTIEIFFNGQYFQVHNVGFNSIILGT